MHGPKPSLKPMAAARVYDVMGSVLSMQCLLVMTSAPISAQMPLAAARGTQCKPDGRTAPACISSWGVLHPAYQDDCSRPCCWAVLPPAAPSAPQTMPCAQACKAGTKARDRTRHQAYIILASLAGWMGERCWHRLAGLRRLPSWRRARLRTRRDGPASTWSSWSSTPSSAASVRVVPFVCP